MLLRLHRLSGSLAGHSKVFISTGTRFVLDTSVHKFNYGRYRPFRLCHTGRQSVVSKCITAEHYQISICRRGSLSLHLTSRQFHTSGRRNALPPVIWIVVSYISKISVALTGRKWRNWLQKQPLHIQKKHRQGIQAMFATLGAFLVVFSGFYYYAHQRESPITGKKKFITVTREQMLKVAQFESDSYLEEYEGKLLSATDPLYGAVVKVANRLVDGNQDIPGMKNQNWVIHIIDVNEKNAFVLPNGHIFVYTGLLKFVENEDQLGIVLGHEMAHALLLHSAQQISFLQLIDWFIIFGMALIWLILPNDGIAVIANWFYKKVMDLTVHMPYSRELEEEADYVGFKLASKACFDIREGSVFWTLMTIADDMRGEQKTPAWLSTHPSHRDRVKSLNQLMTKAILLRDECNCPKLPPNDPRIRATRLRNGTDNYLRAKGSNANLQTLERIKLKPEQTLAPNSVIDGETELSQSDLPSS